MSRIPMFRPLTSRRWSRILSAAAAGLLLNTALVARAGMVITVQDVSAAPGSTGNTLEVDLQNTGSSPVAITGFNFQLTVSAGSGVSFTGADTSTTDTYIFAGNSFLGPSIGSPPYGTTLNAGDVAASGSTSMAPGILGLGRVLFDVAGSASAGPVTVTVTPYPVTSLTAPDGSNIPIATLNNGTITIKGSVVPEPSALLSATLGFLGAAWLIRGQRAASR